MIDFTTFLLSIPVVILVAITIFLFLDNRRLKKTKQKIVDVRVQYEKLQEDSRDLMIDKRSLEEQLGEEREKNRTILSQKKSSETRLGQISEHLVPILANCRHNPKDMHFMGNPIDYLVFDFDEGKITFLEVKSGNSKASKRQKTIKNIIKSSRVEYEEMRINEKGVRSKVTTPNEIQDFVKQKVARKTAARKQTQTK